MTPFLFGGEMPHWTDRSPVRGEALRLLAASAHGHTLIVGPHHPELIDAVGSRQVTVLVRGVPDAEALAVRYAGRPGIEIRCGSLSKLAAVPAYDTVVALDGLDRTGSTETPDLTWAAGLALLLAVLRPGGRLLLGCANPAGLHRLYAAAREPGDADWAAPAGDDPTLPVGLAGLREHLASAGLTLLQGYAAYPSPQAPAVLLSEAALADPDLHGLLTSALRRAGRPPGPLLADPAPLAADLLRHGLVAALAPAWLVAAALPGQNHPPPPGAVPAPAGGDLVSLPEAVPAPAGGDPVSLPEAVLAPAGGDPVSLPEAVLAPAGGDLVSLRRTPHGWTLGDTAEPAPAGRCLHDVLLSAARAGDLPRMRALLAAWQSGAAAAVTADAILLTGDGTLRPLATPTDPAEALRRFASALHDEGLAHRWPPEGSAELLAAMAGVEIGPDPAARPGPGTFRELSAAHDRLARELAEARAQIEWYERSAVTMRAELSRAHRVIAVLRATTPGRAATAVLGGVRGGRRLARTVLTRLRSIT
ncbi:hypothetical protein [Actinoplanes sp. NPDC049802]|uniref:hypothetical protein n=1 Tax=Actinoplanes sp. NPDC049802 TaxID=3154742 RepID=UPI0033CD67C8